MAELLQKYIAFTRMSETLKIIRVCGDFVCPKSYLNMTFAGPMKFVLSITDASSNAPLM